MKLNPNISGRLTGRIIQRFGNASLVRHRNGEHELLGGSRAERAAAFEWVSLFAHEIVFSHFHGESEIGNRAAAAAARLQPAF